MVLSSLTISVIIIILLIIGENRVNDFILYEFTEEDNFQYQI
jgi:hypothetical protein